MGIEAAVIAAAVIGAGTSMYTAERQSKAQEEAANKEEQARRFAEEEKKRIARETAPDQEGASKIEFGTGDGETGSVEEFLKPKTTQVSSGLGTTGRSGLGFKL